jgi:hypothetical protein
MKLEGYLFLFSAAWHAYCSVYANYLRSENDSCGDRKLRIED